jgi:hypothetical protein
MATKKVFKTMFEVRDEKAELRGLRKGILALIAETSLTNTQIAKMVDVEEAFVKAIRQEFLASKQQA